MRSAIFWAIMLISSSAYAQPDYGHHSGWNMHGYGIGDYSIWLFFIVLIAAVAFLFVRQQSGGGTGTAGETPLEILKKRYARGEISKEEYESMKKDLS